MTTEQPLSRPRGRSSAAGRPRRSVKFGGENVPKRKEVRQPKNLHDIFRFSLENEQDIYVCKKLISNYGITFDDVFGAAEQDLFEMLDEAKLSKALREQIIKYLRQLPNSGLKPAVVTEIVLTDKQKEKIERLYKMEQMAKERVSVLTVNDHMLKVFENSKNTKEAIQEHYQIMHNMLDERKNYMLNEINKKEQQKIADLELHLNRADNRNNKKKKKAQKKKKKNNNNVQKNTANTASVSAPAPASDSVVVPVSAPTTVTPTTTEATATAIPANSAETQPKTEQPNTGTTAAKETKTEPAATEANTEPAAVVVVSDAATPAEEVKSDEPEVKEAEAEAEAEANANADTAAVVAVKPAAALAVAVAVPAEQQYSYATNYDMDRHWIIPRDLYEFDYFCSLRALKTLLDSSNHELDCALHCELDLTGIQFSIDGIAFGWKPGEAHAHFSYDLECAVDLNQKTGTVITHALGRQINGASVSASAANKELTPVNAVPNDEVKEDDHAAAAAAEERPNNANANAMMGKVVPKYADDAWQVIGSVKVREILLRWKEMKFKLRAQTRYLFRLSLRAVSLYSPIHNLYNNWRKGVAVFDIQQNNYLSYESASGKCRTIYEQRDSMFDFIPLVIRGDDGQVVRRRSRKSSEFFLVRSSFKGDAKVGHWVAIKNILEKVESKSYKNSNSYEQLTLTESMADAVLVKLVQIKFKNFAKIKKNNKNVLKNTSGAENARKTCYLIQVYTNDKKNRIPIGFFGVNRGYPWNGMVSVKSKARIYQVVGNTASEHYCDDEFKYAAEFDVDLLNYGTMTVSGLGAMTKLFDTTLIPSYADMHKLAGWCPGGRSNRFNLLYRASRDGWAAADFHTKSDAAKQTVVVMYADNGDIFGGYTSKSWDKSFGSWRTDEQAFIFLLRSTVKTVKPGKFPVTGASTATYANSSYGPNFGNGPDIEIKGTKTIKTDVENGSASYSAPKNNTAFGGAGKTCDLKDYEVYEIP